MNRNFRSHTWCFFSLDATGWQPNDDNDHRTNDNLFYCAKKNYRNFYRHVATSAAILAARKKRTVFNENVAWSFVITIMAFDADTFTSLAFDDVIRWIARSIVSFPQIYTNFVSFFRRFIYSSIEYVYSVAVVHTIEISWLAVTNELITFAHSIPNKLKSIVCLLLSSWYLYTHACAEKKKNDNIRSPRFRFAIKRNLFIVFFSRFIVNL